MGKLSYSLLIVLLSVVLINSRRHHKHRNKPSVAAIVNNDAVATAYDDRQGYVGDIDQTVATQASNQLPSQASPINSAYNVVYKPPEARLFDNSTPTPNDVNDLIARDLWKNHSIPFVKEFKQQIDGNKIKHHDYEELTWFMKYFAEQYPDITRLYTLGSSVQNRKLWAMEITDNPGKHDAGEPEMKYIGNIHGNEVIGREILLQLIKHLCENYKKDDDVTSLVDKTRIHILPSMNPDGYELAAAHKKSDNPDVTEDVIGRLNANGVDLNRNFPDQFFEGSADNNEPETQSVIEWIKKYPFSLSASFHSGALVVTYPFDDSPSGQSQYSATPDDDLFRTLAKTYSENHPQMHLANPKMNCTRALRRFTDGISNGAAWSSLSGGMQDYNYVRSNCYEITVELGCRKFPSESELAGFWEDNKKPLLKFIGMANKGVRGFVKDESGNPIKGARVSVGDRKHDIHSSDDGDYWRLLVPGTYDIEAHAKGFKTEIASIEVPNGDSAVVNFTMIPKQIDELESTLGHVNRATVISHDLMYRYDGRDSGNSVPKAVIAKVEDQQVGREGTTEQQDTIAMDPDVGSGSGLDEAAQAQRLAESLAMNNMPLTKITKMSSFKRDNAAVPSISKRTKISRPDKTKKKTKSASKKSKTKASKVSSTNTAAVNSTSNSTKAISLSPAKLADLNPSNSTIDQAISRSVEDLFHVKPVIGMHVRCKVPGKSDKMKGSLRYIGHITNLPKRNNVIVAGIELDHDEELGTDGTFLGKRYFITTPKKGYFVPVKNCNPI